MATACTFCRIFSGEIPAEIVWEDATSVAFLDHRPLFPGHVLLAPRAHIVTLPELPRESLEPLFGNAQRLCRAVEHVCGAQGTFVAMNNVVSQSVPHLHVHIVPRSKGDGLKGFFWPRNRYRDDAHRQEVAAAIRAALETL